MLIASVRARVWSTGPGMNFSGLTQHSVTGRSQLFFSYQASLSYFCHRLTKQNSEIPTRQTKN